MYYSCSATDYRQVSFNVALWQGARVMRINKIAPPFAKVKKICNAHAKIVILAAEMNDCADEKKSMKTV